MIARRKPSISIEHSQLINSAMAAITQTPTPIVGSELRLAEILNIDHSYISRWKSGKCRITRANRALQKLIASGHIELVREAMA